MLQKLPIGKQDFKQIINRDFLYVDKTEYLLDLVNTQDVYFLSRPRRFGKSLTVSILKYLFLGEKELFKDTYIEDKWTFKKHKVVHLSLGSVDSSSKEDLRISLNNKIENLADQFGVKDLRFKPSPTLNFENLLLNLGEESVVLIDEYDKPVINNFTNPELPEIMKELRSFYSVLKEAGEYLRFIFLTGISKFSKVGVFSELNNLVDISFSDRYSAIVGITREELESYFDEYLNVGAERFKISKKRLIDDIQEYYNGFSFNGRDFLYNSFSILNFFNDFTFKNYWFESGSSAFIAEYAKENNLSGRDLENAVVFKDIFSSYEIYNAPPESFLTQAGYLTLKESSEQHYTLDFPNKEVKQSFYRLLLTRDFGAENQSIIEGEGKKILDSFRNKDFDSFLSSLRRIFASIPAGHFKNLKYRESFFQTHLYVLLTSLGLTTWIEKQLSGGMSDLVVKYSDEYYIFELKDRPPMVSIQQIRDKKYYEEYQGLSKAIYLVGLQISTKERNFIAGRIEEL